MENKKKVIEGSVVPTNYSDGEKMGYKHSASCRVCMAKNRKGESLRDKVDEMALNHTSKEIVDYLVGEGLMISQKSVLTHLSRHAPYVAEFHKMGSKKIQKMIVHIKQTGTEVSQALQRIVDMGDAMVQDGQMPVTEKLYIEALKEQGRRGIKTSLDTEFETMDQDFIKTIQAGKNV